MSPGGVVYAPILLYNGVELERKVKHHIIDALKSLYDY